MLFGFKTELKINNHQRTQLLQHCGVARHAWNWGLALTKQILEHNKLNPNSKIKFPTAIDLHKWLVALVKSENPWYYECSKSAPQEALRALKTAWDRCFKKISGVPKFKRKGKHDSFTLEGSVKNLESNKIQVPKIGVLQTYERLPQKEIKSVTISRKANRWFISFRFDVEKQDNKNLKVVGVDLGVKNLATLSTGEIIEGAKSYKKYESKLSRLQWLNRNKVINSNNWRKAQLKIAKLHLKIANIRKDTLHKLTTLLAKNHGKVVIEDLNVSGMLANRKLAKAISDMGFHEFRRQLTYKCELYSSELVVVDRWYPSSKTCSNCGTKKENLTLNERVFQCENCGFECDRDLNAAINLSKIDLSKAVS
ncbi:RNA-guided endonuclease InsQ/TnpB family protein [Nodularia spumigena]|uniref:Putative transposase n=2 Tax=Nodularia spumigena TaxID=70799 RepID=A0A2S0Q9H1_NODSP|nr:RNA-guided endonuclease TnpB family protein [Nodularia spumigena]AHJ27467.1 Transposase, IS605 OrfB [Nodularia spumigena CCY9414]AHJ29860.1 Transposase, IS605 OrfB [Nodularia spumigena CCY9414]AVZ31018.1 putative transposase [Nodularia spumigena UHCC 0039]